MLLQIRFGLTHPRAWRQTTHPAIPVPSSVQDLPSNTVRLAAMPANQVLRDQAAWVSLADNLEDLVTV